MAGKCRSKDYIEPGSLWENDYCESFNGKLRGELLNGEIFYSLKEAKIVIGQWRNLSDNLSDKTCTVVWLALSLDPIDRRRVAT